MADEMNRDMMDREMKGIKMPSLTLEPEEKEDSGFYEETEERAGAVDESMLSEEERKQVEAFVDQIDVSNIKMVNSYGASAQNSIAAFSVSITENQKTREFGEIGDSLSELQVAIRSTTAPEKKGLLGLFQKGKNKVSYLIANYESAETNIKKIEQDLQRHRQVLTKDIYIYDQMYDQNLAFYKELTMYIIAGKKALEKAKKAKLIELRK